MTKTIFITCCESVGVLPSIALGHAAVTAELQRQRIEGLNTRHMLDILKAVF